MSTERGDRDSWTEEMRRRLDEMRKVLEEIGQARRRRRWASEEGESEEETDDRPSSRGAVGIDPVGPESA